MGPRPRWQATAVWGRRGSADEPDLLPRERASHRGVGVPCRHVWGIVAGPVGRAGSLHDVEPLLDPPSVGVENFSAWSDWRSAGADG